MKNYQAQDVRVVCYLSAEFLTGPHLANNLINLGIYDEAEQAMRQLGLDLNVLIEQEEEPGLGNGGLGRLASCFMDSLATLDIPAIGYGIRYEYGIFDQQIRDGWQVETDRQVAAAGQSLGAGAARRRLRSEDGRAHREAHRRQGHGCACTGFRNGWCAAFRTTRRSWATAPTPPTPCGCGRRRPWRASTSGPSTPETSSARWPTRSRRENISKILYPNDEGIQGKQLRLEQQFFFVSCCLQHIREDSGSRSNRPLADLHRNFAIQMNDTHPAIAVAELMRLLVDEHAMEWDAAWHVTAEHALLHQSHAAAGGAGAVAA